MIKNLKFLLREYKSLAFVIIAIIAGGITDILRYHQVAHVILGLSALLATIPLIWGMIESIRSGEYGLDILAATAIITSVILGEYWAGMVVVLMLTGGEALEDYAEQRAKSELSSLLKRKPKLAHLIKGGQTIDIAVKEVKVGDRLKILPGEVVPVDAVIVEGESSFDESSLTGESIPVEKAVNDQLLSGSINIDGAITVRALRTAGDSQYQQIIKLVRSAASSQSPFVRLADRYSIPFTVISFMIAGTVWVLSGSAIRFLEVLVVATPCPLLLGAPIALISGMSRAAKYGIIVKTGSALERLAEVQTVAFDKTGTLTKGTPVVDQIVSLGKLTKKEILALAAGLEQSSNHILATGILEAAHKSRLKIPKVKQVKEIAGKGLSGRVDGKDVMVGRFSLLQDQSVSIPKGFKRSSIKQTVTYLTVDGELVGYLTFIDEVRPESKKMIKMLHRLGIKHTLMVTGDNSATALAIAKELGITDVVAEALPGDKILALQEIVDRPVAFVGDGVNDAPVLTAADVGIALGASGSTAASESADVVIMLDKINLVGTALNIAKRTFYIARQSILVGIFISLALMLIFATGRFKPVLGAAIQELVDITVIINALRAHGGWGRERRLLQATL